MTFLCMAIYFKHESRLPIGQPFDPDKTDLHRNRLKLSTSCGIMLILIGNGLDTLVWTRLLYVAHIYKLLQSSVVVNKIIS